MAKKKITDYRDTPALTLKETTLADGKVAYLDRQIEIRDRQLLMSLYDKRDDFPFAIHNYPHLDSNLPRACQRIRMDFTSVNSLVLPRPATSIPNF